jgi:hypothetical protein
VLVWQGDQDLMVPAPHAAWLREHVAGAQGETLLGEGHLTVFVNRRGRRPRLAGRAAALSLSAGGQALAARSIA